MLMHVRRISGFLLLIMVMSTPARAASVDDLVNLKMNGLSDAVLIELIQTDGSIFRLSADDILTLQKRGLSSDVILAMVRTARYDVRPVQTEPEARTATETSAPASSGVVVTQTVTQTVEAPPSRTEYVYVPVSVPVYLTPAPIVRAIEPVYWGFGGQRRADTWGPRAPIVQPDRPADVPVVRK